MQMYLLVINDLLIIRIEIEKRNDIYWDLPYIWYVCVIESRSQKPISDRVSMLLLKIV